jgi:hypothetical protein
VDILSETTEKGVAEARFDLKVDDERFSVRHLSLA